MYSRHPINFHLLMLFILLPTICALAGIIGSLEGTVVDKATGEALIGANVMILETKQGGVTNLNCFYKIHNIRAGVYSVKISMIGYRSTTYTGISILPDLRTKLRAELQESAVDLGTMVVHAERPLIQTDVTGTAYELSAQKIEELPIDRFQQVLGLQPGTTIEGHVRGGKPREVIYLIDGLPVVDYVKGGLGSDLPKSAISQLSVKTGGFDAEYGNALSGVVNVITRMGGPSHQIFLRAEKDDLFGGEEINKTSHFECTLNGPILRDRLYYFSANRLRLTDGRWWQDMRYYFDSPMEKQLNGLSKFDWLISSSKRMSVQFLYDFHRWRDYEFTWRFNLDGLPRRQNQSLRGALFWTHNLSPNCYYNITFNHYFQGSKIGDTRPQPETIEPYQYDFFLLYIISGQRALWADLRQHVSSAKIEYTNQLHPLHVFKAGGEWRYFNIRSELIKMEPQKSYFGKPLIDVPPLNYSNNYHYYPQSGSFYIQDKFESPVTRSVISAGLRFDFLDPRANRPAIELVPVSQDEYEERVGETVPAKVQYHFSPRLGFTFPVTARTFFFINYGQYIQYPLFEYLYSGLDNVKIRFGSNVLRGNPNLLAERTRAWELSMRHHLVENIVVSMLYFKKETFDQIDTKTFVPSNSRIAGDYGFAEYVNNPHAISHGFELVITREKGDWIRGDISYTHMKATGTSEYEEQGINYAQWGFPVANSPYFLSWDQRHTVKADILCDLPLGVRANVVWHYHTGRPYTYYPSKDGFTPDDPYYHFLPNNRRMPANNFLDIRIGKDISLASASARARGIDHKLGLYLYASNIMDERNVIWMDACGRIGGELGDPGAYYCGRRITVGLKLDW